MAAVVDASAVAAVAFDEDPAVDLTRALSEETLFAPTLIDYELTSIAWKKLRRHPRERMAIAAGLQAAARLRIEKVTPDLSEVLALALLSDLTVYDASYLWLARAKRLPLVTLDQRLARAASAR
ncbi:MAG: type II toxin-antitoxin system VapC family toxin [Vicinamibacterales bacterium]